MKKILVLSMLLWIVSSISQQAYAQYPIPSNNVCVYGRAFFEENQTFRGKRNVIVGTVCMGSSMNTSHVATVYIYTLDYTTILGPFYLGCGESVTIPIDDREWGVMVETDEKVIVNVSYSGT